LLLRALENQPSTTHRVVLSPLKEETTYYFRIRVGEEIYDNNGIPYSFKTKPGEVMVSPTVAVQPTVAATPTSTGSDTKVTTCNKSEFMEKFGTSDDKYDFDENGTVNTSDWVQCLNQNN
jgi:hypothetical protein